ncbi:MAG: hypothetical protein ACRC33_22710 [Gemmataceae bacterium]
MINAAKVRKGRDEALAVARTARTVVVARGKKVLTFDLTGPVDEDELAAALLGPTGNLKAPTLRTGTTLLVGFGEAAYAAVLGAN